jgi:hypothetical protein
MRASHNLAAFALLGTLFAAPALAQGEGAAPVMDYDTLAACSIIYQEIGRQFTENEDVDKGIEFTQAATAYAASALHMLGYEITDPNTAYSYSEQRMHEVVDALNKAAEANPDGDMGVITEWLPYCDELGPSVNTALAKREARGW